MKYLSWTRISIICEHFSFVVANGKHRTCFSIREQLLWILEIFVIGVGCCLRYMEGLSQPS